MDKLYQVRGCSMMPTLADGDVIEIVTGQWQNGDIVVARVGSKNVVKRVVGDKLVGDNVKVSAIFNFSDVLILGKIRKKLHHSTNDHLLQAEAATNFGYTGSVQTWTVPTTGLYKLEVWGASGGRTSSNSPNTGFGGYSYGKIYLTEGQVLYIYVGDSGFPGNLENGSAGAGGWNGGGKGGAGSTPSYRGSGGGGATDIRTLSDPIIVAGGGGGGGGGGSYPTPSGADGGGTTGTRLGGGSLGVGSKGGDSTSYGSYGGGGGGGGYYGGRGGAGDWGHSEGGYGGTGYIGGVQDGSTVSGVNSGRGKATITLLNVVPTISILNPATNQSFSTASGRKTITISGTVSDPDNDNVTISAAINGKTKSTVISNTSTAKTWSLTWDVSADNIAEGSYSNILVTADDGMGSIATATMGYTLTVDRTVPVISISGVANGLTYQNSVTPTFSATDAGGSGLASVTATLNGVSYTSGTAITSAGSKVLIATATDKAGNQSQQSVNFVVNKAPSIVLFSPATNQSLSEGQVILVTENSFTVRITPNDDAGDTLQYKITRGGVIKVDWQNCTRGIAFDYTFTDLPLGNSVCQVIVKDDKGGQVTRTFTLRNKASGSISAALSQKGVREVLIALGYPGTAFSCLNDLKPSGYTGPLSFSGIINYLS